MDFGEYGGGGQKFLVTVDHTSGWQFVQHLGQHARTSQLIDATRTICCHTGVFKTLWTDGGLQFRSKAFRTFLRQWGVKAASHHRSIRSPTAGPKPLSK